MTNHPNDQPANETSTAPDPMRALDPVTPPDRWDDVVARSQNAEVFDLSEGRSRRPSRALMAAAAVLAVVAVGAALFAVTRDDEGPQQVATEPDGPPVEAGLAVGFWSSVWELTELERDGEPWEIGDRFDGTAPQLTTGEPGAEAIGYAACNQAGGTATIEAGLLVVTELASTAMACSGDDPETASDLMDQEEFVHGILMDRPTIAIEPAGDQRPPSVGDRLTLSTASGSATFVRKAVVSVPGAGDQPFGIWGGHWQVESITEGGEDRPVVNAQDGVPLWLDASTEGRVAFNGCNGAGGEATVDDDRLLVGELGPSTDMACGAPGLMEQEEWLGRFLLAGPTIEIEADQLTLSTDSVTMNLRKIAVAGPDDTGNGAGTGGGGPDQPVSSPGN